MPAPAIRSGTIALRAAPRPATRSAAVPAVGPRGTSEASGTVGPAPRSGRNHAPLPEFPACVPGNKNRRAALARLPEIQHPLAEEVLKGGVPGLRRTIDRMNRMAQAEGIPQVKSEPLVALAEKLTPVLNSAVWRDRAEAAIAGIDKVDLRDIRSVVVAADSGARDEESP